MITSDAPAMTDPSATDVAAEDLRLARLHLRLGMLDTARAELEDLARREGLGLGGLAALAEARWRGGDLDAATEAAHEHLRAGGADLIAIVVAAEAAAAGGRPGESRDFVERARALDAPTLDAVFAGMPRRAYWPAAGAGAEGSGAEDGGIAPADRPGAASTPAGREPPRAVPGPGDVLAANAGLWNAEAAEPAAGLGGSAAEPALRPTPAPAWVEPARQKGHADPEAELDTARDELGDAPERGLLRLALVLRLDPTLAPDVLEAVRLRREPAALVIRGDAERLLGRHLEAEAEFAEAAEAIERDAIAHARRRGHHAPREDS